MLAYDATASTDTLLVKKKLSLLSRLSLKTKEVLSLKTKEVVVKE